MLQGEDVALGILIHHWLIRVDGLQLSFRATPRDTLKIKRKRENARNEMALSASVKDKIPDLRRVITESLRVQRSGEAIDYVDVGMVLSDALARQNHAIFARRGCGKTLLLHYSSKMLPNEIKSVYLNCEDFKRHTFPNVLIEILQALFRTLKNNQSGWFGRKRLLKEIYYRKT